MSAMNPKRTILLIGSNDDALPHMHFLSLPTCSFDFLCIILLLHTYDVYCKLNMMLMI